MSEINKAEDVKLLQLKIKDQQKELIKNTISMETYKNEVKTKDEIIEQFEKDNKISTEESINMEKQMNNFEKEIEEKYEKMKKYVKMFQKCHKEVKLLREKLNLGKTNKVNQQKLYPNVTSA